MIDPPDRNNRYKCILLFGSPGAGKGTQGKILGAVPGFCHLSSGEVFRNLDPRSEIGRACMEYTSRGELVPDKLTIDIFLQNIHAREVLGMYMPMYDLLLLDGIPRNVEQARIMDSYIKVLKVIYLVIKDQDEMITRMRRRALKENRVDDSRVEVIKRRFEIYENETRPVLEHYPSNMVHEVDALGSPAVVLQHVLELVAPVQSAHFRNVLE